MEIQPFELEIIEYADGTGRMDKYYIDDTGRWLEESYPMSADEVRSMNNAAVDETPDDGAISEHI